jgi:hypothetical protein
MQQVRGGMVRAGAIAPVDIHGQLHGLAIRNGAAVYGHMMGMKTAERLARVGNSSRKSVLA